jgi:hypothetical protein
MKQIQFLVTLNVSEDPQNNEHIEAATKVALNSYLVDHGLSSEEDPAIIHGVEAVKRVTDAPFYVVWNEPKTEGFATRDYQMAYETRKCADTNLFYDDGEHSKLAAAFCEIHGEGNCTTQEVK